MMEHDFKGALDDVMSCQPLDKNDKAIVFALRFTEQALNGEVSEGMCCVAYNATLQRAISEGMARHLFKAMINKLAEEVRDNV